MGVEKALFLIRKFYCFFMDFVDWGIKGCNEFLRQSLGNLVFPAVEGYNFFFENGRKGKRRTVATLSIGHVPEPLNYSQRFWQDK